MHKTDKKKSTLRSAVILSLGTVLLTTILFIGFISTVSILRLGNIFVSLAEKDITNEYIRYVELLMENKAQEYSHIIDLGVKLSDSFVTSSDYIYKNRDNFTFPESDIESFKNSFLLDKSKSFIYSQTPERVLIIGDTSFDKISRSDLSLFYALTKQNLFIKDIFSVSTYYNYLRLTLFSKKYNLIYTKNAALQSLILEHYKPKLNATENKDEAISADKSRFSVRYSQTCIDGSDAVTCTSNSFDSDNKPILSVVTALDKSNLSNDMQIEEDKIIRTWKDLDSYEYARKYVFTFIYDNNNFEILSVNDLRLNMLGFSEKEKSRKSLSILNSSNKDIQKLPAEITTKEKGLINIRLDSLKYLLIYHKLKHTDCYIISAVPYSILEMPANNAQSEVINVIYEFNIYFIFLSALLFAAASIVIIYILRKFVILPVRHFSQRAAKMSAGNFAVSFSPSGARELYNLGISFNKLAAELRRNMNNLESEVSAQHEIDSEMHVARELQQSLLPRFEAYADDTRFSIFCDLIPAKEVAGDFYDLMKLSDNKFMLLIADVSGKGISASFFMSISKNIIRNCCINEPDNPASAIKTANQILSKYNTNMFVTVFLCYINLDDGKIAYANAGHNEPLIIGTDGQTRYFGKLGNSMAGFIEDLDFALAEESLLPGETLLLYTDGVTEATSQNEDKELFEEERLAETVSKYHTSDLKDISKELINAINAFDMGIHSDDITIVLFRRS